MMGEFIHVLTYGLIFFAWWIMVAVGLFVVYIRERLGCYE